MADHPPFIRREPGDFLSASDWNGAQTQVRSALGQHRHGDDAAGLKSGSIDPSSPLEFRSTQVGDLTVGDVPAAELPIPSLIGKGGLLESRISRRLRVGESVKGDLKVQGNLHVRGDLRVSGGIDLAPGGAAVEAGPELHEISFAANQGAYREVGDLRVPVRRRSTLLLLLRANKPPSSPVWLAGCYIKVIYQVDGQWFALQPRVCSPMGSSYMTRTQVPLSVEALRDRLKFYETDRVPREGAPPNYSPWSSSAYMDRIEISPGAYTYSPSAAIAELGQTRQHDGPDLRTDYQPGGPFGDLWLHTVRALQLVHPLDEPPGDVTFRFFMASDSGSWQVFFQVMVLPL